MSSPSPGTIILMSLCHWKLSTLCISFKVFKSSHCLLAAKLKPLSVTFAGFAPWPLNSVQNALEIALEGCEEIERVYRKGAKSVDDLKEVRHAV